MVIPAIPPTTPPAITPMFELFEVDCAVEDSVAEVDVAVKEADTLVIDGIIELVDCTWVEVASGESKVSVSVSSTETSYPCTTNLQPVPLLWC